MKGVIKCFYSILLFAFVYSIQAQTSTTPNINDPYNTLGNPQNPNNLPQAQYGNPNQVTTAVDTTAEDTTKAVKEKYGFRNNPLIASLASTLVPGLGQVYNGKFWKVPIFVGLMGTFGYFIIDNDKRYNDFRDAYIYLQRRDPDNYRIVLDDETSRERYTEIYNKHTNQMYPFPDSTGGATSTQAAFILQNQRDFARKNRDWMVIFFLLTYVCNIMDASVDAHFAKFDISDKLSMKVEPSFISPGGRAQIGLNINLTFSDNRRKKQTISRD